MILNHVRNFKPRVKISRCIVRCNSSSLSEAREKLKSLGEGKIHMDRDEESEIATVTIDNIGKRNAISGSMMVQLETVMDELETWDAGKGLILKSSGNIFCSGGDISKTDEGLPPDGSLMSAFMQHTLTRLFSLPLITVTLVNGRAIGGGAELTTATDFRLFSNTGEVRFVQGKMGVVTGWGGGTRLVKILGPRLALDLLTTSKKLMADDALRIGFADGIVTGSDEVTLATQAKKWLSERLTHHHSVTQAFKKIVVGARDMNLGESLLNERKIFSPLWGGPVNLEALSKSIKHK